MILHCRCSALGPEETLATSIQTTGAATESVRRRKLAAIVSWHDQLTTVSKASLSRETLALVVASDIQTRNNKEKRKHKMRRLATLNRSWHTWPTLQCSSMSHFTSDKKTLAGMFLESSSTSSRLGFSEAVAPQPVAEIFFLAYRSRNEWSENRPQNISVRARNSGLYCSFFSLYGEHSPLHI